MGEAERRDRHRHRSTSEGALITMAFAQFVPLSSVAEVNPGSPDLFSDSNATVDFLPMADIGEDGTIQPSQTRVVSEVRAGFTNFQEDDVLVAKITPCFENGKIALVRGLVHGAAAGSTEFHVVRPSPSIEPRFLAHALRSASFRFHGAKRMRGAAGQRRVPPDFIRSWMIPDLSKMEQRRIADILDQADALRRKQQEADQLADDYLESLFREIVGSPADYEKSWPMKPLQEVCEGGGQYGSNAPSTAHSSGHRYIRITDITEKGDLNDDVVGVDLSSSDIEKYRLHDGDLLFARSGATVGKVYLYRNEDGPAVYAGYLIRYVANRNEVLPEFLFGFTRTEAYRQWVRSKQKVVAQPNINAKQYGYELMVPVPPKQVQDRFVGAVQRVRAISKQQRAGLVQADALVSALTQGFFG